MQPIIIEHKTSVMTKYQSSRFKMLNNVLATFAPDTKTIWSAFIMIVLTLDNLLNLEKNMKAASGKKGGKKGGATKDKQETLKPLIIKGHKASIRLKQLAKVLNNTKLAAEASFTKRDFAIGGEQAIVDRATWVLTESRLLEKDGKAAACGVTPANNDELADLLTTLDKKDDTQQGTSNTQIKLTKDLSDYFKQLTQELKNLDDAMLANIAETNPDFYQLYLIARRKIDPPSKPRKGDDPTPPAGV